MLLLTKSCRFWHFLLQIVIENNVISDKSEKYIHFNSLSNGIDAAFYSIWLTIGTSLKVLHIVLYKLDEYKQYLLPVTEAKTVL